MAPSVRTATTRYRTIDVPAAPRVCPGCSEGLPAQATFCTQCGLYLLEPMEEIEEIDTAEVVLELEPEEIEIEIDLEP